jgi:hypothetical protein
MVYWRVVSKESSVIALFYSICSLSLPQNEKRPQMLPSGGRMFMHSLD